MQPQTEPVQLEFSLKQTRSVWTDAMLARVKTKWIGGLSLKQIAADISTEFRVTVSRNAVVGQVRRQQWDLKWPRQAPANITEARERKARENARPDVENAREHKPRKQRQDGAARQKFVPQAPKYGECIPDHVEIPPGQGIYPEHWLCQWPQVKPTDALRCAEPRVEGRPYCTAHCRRAFTQIGNPNPYNRGFIKWATRGDGK